MMNINSNLSDNETGSISAGSITMDTGQWIVSVAGKPVDLTYIEYLLLKTLMTERGKVVSREALLKRVWSYENATLLETRTVDVHIGRLRKKLGESGHIIVTVRHVGYRMAFSPEWISR